MSDVSFGPFKDLMESLKTAFASAPAAPSAEQAFNAGFHAKYILGNKFPNQDETMIEGVTKKLSDVAFVTATYFSLEFVPQLAGLCGMLRASNPTPRILVALDAMAEKYQNDAKFGPAEARDICINLIATCRDIAYDMASTDCRAGMVKHAITAPQPIPDKKA